MFSRPMTMYAYTMQYDCDITCRILKPAYRTHAFSKHECYFNCVSKQRKSFSLYFQADAWLYNRMCDFM